MEACPLPPCFEGVGSPITGLSRPNLALVFPSFTFPAITP